MELLQTPRVMKLLAVFLGVLSIFFVIKSVLALKELRFIGSGTTATNTIQVQGEGEAFAIPDIAQISGTMRAEAKTMKEAQAKVKEVEAKLLAYVKEQGIADKDVKTTNYSAYPKYEWQAGQSYPCTVDGVCPPSRGGKNVMTGYEVSETITLKVRDTEKAGVIVDGIGKIGVSEITGPDYTVDDDNVIKADARKKAIDDAKAKAEVLAKDLGVKLIRIVSFAEGNTGGYPVPMYAKMENAMMGGADTSAPELPVGENKYTSMVTITYEIR